MAVSIGKAHAKNLFSAGRSRQQERGVYAAETPARAEPFWMAGVALPADIWQPEGRVPIKSPGARQTHTMRMNRYLIGVGICLAWLAILPSGCGKKEAAPPGAEVLARFAEAKEKQAKELNKKQSYRWPGEASRYFEAMEAGRWNEASNLFAELDRKYNSFAASAPTNGWDGFKMKAYALVSRVGGLPRNYWPRLDGSQWEPVKEVKGACDAFQKWDPEMLLLFGSN